MNSINITGRWVSEPKTSEVGENKKTEARIAYSHAKDKSYFFNVVFWGKSAELAEQYIRKGGAASVSGRLTQDTWEKDGEKREKVFITAERFDFAILEKSDGVSNSASTEKSNAKPVSKSAPKRSHEEEDDIF